MEGMRKLLLSAGALLLALFLGLALPQPCARAQNPQLTKRLILKDGSYQPATKWEVHGDRVRYYSAERYEWEEVPSNLVDWPATEKWEKESASHISEETKELSAELEAERRAEEARTPTVSPGVKLPINGGVFLLDEFRGQPQLVELVQSGGEVKKDMGKNVLRAAINPLASMKQSIELPGTRARVQSHETRPVIYVEVDPDDDSSAGSRPPDTAHRFRLVRLQRKKDSRVVGNLKFAMTGKVSQQESFVETVAEPFSGDWVRVSPAKDLQPGEYALAEMLGEKQVNLYVWDFGVDPLAPANPGAWRPVQPPPSKTGRDESPALGTRK
jgi:hypothetical protein